MAAEHNVWQQALSKAQAVAVQNVMNPLLWLNAVSIPLLLIAAYVFRDDLLTSRVLAFGALIVPLWTLREYGYWRRDDPARLQSERYLIEQQQLMIQSKSTPVPIPASNLPSGENPEIAEMASDAQSATLPPARGQSEQGKGKRDE